MATQSLTRLLSKPKAATSLCRRFSVSVSGETTITTSSVPSSAISRSRLFLFGSLRSLSSAVPSFELRRISFRGYCTGYQPPASSGDRLEEDGKEETVLDGFDMLHWLVIMEKPEGEPSREEIVDSYTKTLAMVVGSEEDAKKRIYSVSTKDYTAFKFNGDKEVANKIIDLPKVRFVVPDLDLKNEDGGVKPEYIKEWLKNNGQVGKYQDLARQKGYEAKKELDRLRHGKTTKTTIPLAPFFGAPFFILTNELRMGDKKKKKKSKQKKNQSSRENMQSPR